MTTPVTKIIVKGKTFEYGKEYGKTVREQTISAKDTNSGPDTFLTDASVAEKLYDGDKLLTLNVPVKDGDDWLDPERTVSVLLYTNLTADDGTAYYWYKPEDADLIGSFFSNLDPFSANDGLAAIAKMLDENDFPATAGASLSFLTYSVDPEDGAIRSSDDIDLIWNPDAGTITTAGTDNSADVEISMYPSLKIEMTDNRILRVTT